MLPNAWLLRSRTLLTVLAALLAIGFLASSPTARSSAAGGRPTIVLVLTDDQRYDTLAQMPATRDLVAAAGVTYTNAMVPTSLCCPSRTSLLTGRFAHETRTWSNMPSLSGGWPAMYHNGNEDRTLAVHLRSRGYRTALIGKYLNLYGSAAPLGHVPPGWNVFDALVTGDPGYYDYRLSDRSEHGHDPQDYSTDVLADRAVDFIKDTSRGRPLFLYFAPFAPHSPYEPAPRHDGAFDGLAPFDPPSLTAGRAGKPAWVRNHEPVRPDTIHWVRTSQAESLQAVDEAVGRLLGALHETGRLDNTLFVFLADNGYMHGEHGLIGKQAPYDAATRIPLVMRWDGRIPAGETDPRLALNIDVTQTILDAAGSPVGTSGRDLLSGPARQGFVLEAEKDPHRSRPAYCGWRSADWMYTRYATGEEELYSYRDDPYELHNLAHDPEFATERSRLERKARAACTPTPPSFSWPPR